MQVSGTQAGAAVYAFKKALELPGTVVELVKQTTVTGQPLKNFQGPGVHPETVSRIKEKGSIIDIFA